VPTKPSGWYGTISLDAAPDMTLLASLRDEWTALEAELDLWAEAGRVASFWWRDDDATDVTPPLERLLRLKDSTRTPLTLAVIPGLATEALASRLDGSPGLTVVQHGFAHRNHAPAGEKKCEFPASRPLQQRIDDLRAGEKSLGTLFPRRLRVLVPPWNRIADMAGDLATMGFIALSGFGLRRHPFAAPGLIQLNTHIDPVDWRGGDVTSGCRTALKQAVLCLQRQRGDVALQQPLGLLTHHLRHDDTGWDFIAAFVELIGRHPGAEWTGLERALKIGLPPRP